MSYSPRPLGLSLSGGGYRAAAFHLGTLKKLQELNLLDQVSVISTISGGSITGAYYCLNKDDFPKFEQDLTNILHRKSVIRKVLLSWTFIQLLLFVLAFLVPAVWSLFTAYAWAFPVLLLVMLFLLLKFQFQLFPVSKKIEKIYDQFFYHQATLSSLPKEPVLVIGSTNLETARPFVFTKNRMGDSSYTFLKPSIQFKAENFPVSRAVMASSCVPFAFTPIYINKNYFRVEEDAKRVTPCLVDGGVYDNQGIHKIVQQGDYQCRNIITSDAGGNGSSSMRFRNTISLLISTVDVFMLRIKKAQMVQDVYDNVKQNLNREIAYFSLAWDAENCIPGFIRNMKSGNISTSLCKLHGLDDEWIKEPGKFEKDISCKLEENVGYKKMKLPSQTDRAIARNVSTNLKALSAKKIQCLIDQAACLTELQVKLYCPSLIPPRHD